MADLLKFSVEGIGDFSFRIRSLADTIRIDSDTVKLLGHDCWHPAVVENARALCALQWLIVGEPEGFSVHEMDALEPDVLETLAKLYEALRAAEEVFRQELKAKRAAAR